jgi:hypothetical protein
MIRKVGVPTPVLNLDALYDGYKIKRVDLDQCFAQVDKMLNVKLEGNITPADMTKWEKVKDKLYLRLFGKINGGIYREMADLYLAPYIQVTSDGSATARVTEDLLKLWEVDEDTVYETAKTNQEILCPSKISNLAEQLGMPADTDIGLYVISTENGICGASAILYEGVASNLRDKIGDFYLLPSSIHEFIAVPKCLGKDVDTLATMVATINCDVDERERLTDSVYEFDFTTNELIKVND